MNHPTVVGLGNALLDVVFEVEDAFLQAKQLQKGAATLINQSEHDVLLAALTGQGDLVTKMGGGSAANSMVALAQLGGRAAYCSLVSEDDSGDQYRRSLAQAGVSFNSTPQSVGVTGQCLVMVTEEGERTMGSFLGISESFSERDVDFEAIARADWLYMEGYLVTSDSAFDAMQKAIIYAKAVDTQVAFTFSDPSMVQFFKPRLDQLLDLGVDLLFCNQKEAELWLESEDWEASIERLSALTQALVVTCGPQGAKLFTQHGNPLHAPAQKIEPILDSNGAGDGFAGAFLHAVIMDLSLAAALQIANDFAAQVVQTAGPRLQQEQVNQLKKQYSL